MKNQDHKPNRRDFLRSSAAFAAGSSALGALAGCATEENDTLSAQSAALVRSGDAPRLIEPCAAFYAVFQSHNQKVVSNRHGIFLSYLHHQAPDFDANEWRLLWSKDGGQTFTVLAQGTDATNPPLLETDADGNLYLVVSHFAGAPPFFGTLYRFLAAHHYKHPTRTPFAPLSAPPNQSSVGKWAMVYHRALHRLHVLDGLGRLWTLDEQGQTLASQVLFDPSSTNESITNRVFEYPHLALDELGGLHVAWTTQDEGPAPALYSDIRYMRSFDQGQTWRRMDGTIETVPGPAGQLGDGIVAAGEIGHGTWLASFRARHGKLHFFYQYAPLGQTHYVRYDLASGQNRLDLLAPAFNLFGLDGFFAARSSEPGTPLYCVGTANDGSGRIACLSSDDEGATWYDYALLAAVAAPQSCETGASVFAMIPYSVGGAREISGDGRIFGTFMDNVFPYDPKNGVANHFPVYFFEIQAGIAQAQGTRTFVANHRVRIDFSAVRGQPQSVRFRRGGNGFDPWRPFDKEILMLPAHAPDGFQLRSSLGVISPLYPLA